MLDDSSQDLQAADVLVADDGGVIGVIVLIAHEDDLLIENVAVEPSRQRKGWDAR
jgi:hypothetical protein